MQNFSKVTVSVLGRICYHLEFTAVAAVPERETHSIFSDQWKQNGCLLVEGTITYTGMFLGSFMVLFSTSRMTGWYLDKTRNTSFPVIFKYSILHIHIVDTASLKNLRISNTSE
jgi:hypothetical protein